MISTLVMLAAALVLDRLMGEPDWLWRRLPHPIVVIGNGITWADKRFNDEDLSSVTRRKRGEAVMVAFIVAAVLAGVVTHALLELFGWIGTLTEIAIVAILLAWKSLIDHVRAVAIGLASGGLDGGRRAVSMIVGRDTSVLDEAGVSRAAIESLAENTSDGIVAPAFWYAVFGLPGILAYKLINTADSMIGHRTPRHVDFGRAAALIDDYANWLPARLTGLVICLVGGKPDGIRDRFDVMLRDATIHRSPNAGWPEAAMAAATGLALGGPRRYKDDIADEPFMNGVGRKDAGLNDIRASVAIIERCLIVLTALVAVLALL